MVGDDVKWFVCWYPDCGETEGSGLAFPANEVETPEIAAAKYAVTRITRMHKKEAELLVRVSWETVDCNRGQMDVAVIVEPASLDHPAVTGWRVIAIDTRSIRAFAAKGRRPLEVPKRRCVPE